MVRHAERECEPVNAWRSVFAWCALASASAALHADELDDALAAYDARNYARALELLKPLAESGDPLAQSNLAYMLYEGQGAKANVGEAEKWYRLAAEQGDANAQYNLGVMYENGSGVPRDLTEAAKWWRLAAQQGYAPAQYNLGALYYSGRGVPKDLVRAYMWKSLALEGVLTNVAPRKARVGRDAIGASMSQAQIAQAKAMMQACVASGFADCD